MGVPAFFRWLTKKYPSIAVQCVEEKAKFNDSTNEKIPVDTTKPNPNDVEFDNLYLDMNGIIHPCTHPEDRPAPKNEDEMMVIIFEFIDRIFSIVRPRKLLYMAIDGVAPRAKMNQQRSRRFRAAKDTTEKGSEIKRIKETIIANGGVVPPDVPQSEKFDSNCITPGTPFMHKLAECLRYYVYDRLNNDPGWKNLTVILSDANVPGEGEHKIMDFIRRQRAQPDHDPNTHHVLCGADADLIMLGLATHEPYFTIIREEFRADKPRPCEICNQYGHDTKECTGMTREKAGAHDEMAGNTFTPAEQRYIFLRLNVLREYLSKELTMTNLPFEFDIERAIDDWVFMCFFVGNDFLPHLPSLEIREGAIDRLVNLYKGMISKADGYLTDCGDVNLERVQIILSGIGHVEDEIFKKRQRNEVEFRQRQKEKKKRQRVGYDMPLQMPEWMKSGPYAPSPLGKKPNQNLIPVSSNKFESLDKSAGDGNEDAESDEAKRGIKRKLVNAPVDGASASATPMDETPANEEEDLTKKKVVDDEVVMVEEEIDEDANDPVRLWEDGWKQRYYKIKFDVDEDDLDFKTKVAHHYTIGLQWVLKYYYQGVPSWNWYFPYHYAPFASDFIDINQAAADFNEESEPFKPFEQLMAVFPAASRKHVPPEWQNLMTDPNSVIIDFYPEDFQVDLNGKKQSWQGVALLPFVDEQRLKRALEALNDRLSPEELKRNSRGYDRLFVGKSHKLYEFFKQAYADREAGTSKDFKNLKHSIELDPKLCGGIAGRVWRDEYAVLENETFISPLRHSCPNLEQNRVISVQYHDPMYESDHVFKANILDGAVIPEATLRPEDFETSRGYRPNTGFGRNYDYRNNRNPNVANRMIQNTLGGSGDNSVASSAYGGQGSLYGSYKSSNQYSNSNNNNNYNNNYNNNRNNNYNNNNFNRNNNNNNNYNNNRNNNFNNNPNPRGNNNYNNNNTNNNSNYYSNTNSASNSNRGNNYNYNNNNNNNNNNFNNNQGYNNNRNNYNNNSYQQNKPQNQHTRFNDGANTSNNNNANQGQNRSNRQN